MKDYRLDELFSAILIIGSLIQFELSFKTAVNGGGDVLYSFSAVFSLIIFSIGFALLTEFERWRPG